MFSRVHSGVAAFGGALFALAACHNTLQFGSGGPESCGTPGAVCSVGTSGVGDGPELKASLVAPFAVAADSKGNLYIADTGENRIRKIDLAGNITTIAGTGSGHADVLEGLPGPQVSVPGPYSVAVDASGAVFWNDSVTCGIFRLDPVSQIVSIVAGGVGCGESYSTSPTAVGTRFDFNGCAHIALDAKGNILFPDYGTIRYLNLGTSSVSVFGISVPGLTATVVAGSYTDTNAGTTNGVQATTLYFNSPCTAATNASGELFIANGGDAVIQMVNSTGGINVVAGTGATGFNGDGGAALSAQLDHPDSFVIDPTGQKLFVFDQSNRVRLVNRSGSLITWGVIPIAAGNIQTVAGGAVFNSPQIAGVTSDGTVALKQGMDFQSYNVPVGVLASGGDLVFPDPGGHVLRRVSSSTDVMSVVAGFGPAGTAQHFLEVPTGVAVDPKGGLYVSALTPYLLHVDPSGVETVVAGNGKVTVTAADNGVSAVLSPFWAGALATDPSGAIYVADPLNNLVRRIDPTGVITTIAGGGSSYGDGGPSSGCQFNGPWGIAVDDSANLFVVDDDNVRFINRGITAVTVAGVTISPGDIDSIAGHNGTGFSGDGGQASSAQLDFRNSGRIPTIGLGFSGGLLFVAENFGHRIRQINLKTGIIETLAGSGVDAPDQVGEPTGLVASAGVVYWAQSTGSYLKSVTLPHGPVRLVGGDGDSGYIGDSGAVSDAEFISTQEIAIGPAGELYVTDGSHRIRVIQP